MAEQSPPVFRTVPPEIAGAFPQDPQQPANVLVVTRVDRGTVWVEGAGNVPVDPRARETPQAKPAPEQAKPVEPVVGRWYVTEGSRTPWCVTRVLCGGLEADAKAPHGSVATFGKGELTPWVPQVGDWVVRMSTDGLYREPPAKVARVSSGFAVFGDGYSGAIVPTPGHYHVEPCLPPTASAQAAPAETSCDCPRCTGPVPTLLCMPCMGRDWRTWEPEVRQEWRVATQFGWQKAHFAGGDAERLWLATGRGVEVLHPLRDEAVRLWRAKVKR